MKIATAIALLLMVLIACSIEHKGEVSTEDPSVDVDITWCSEYKDDRETYERCKEAVLCHLEGLEECGPPD